MNASLEVSVTLHTQNEIVILYVFILWRRDSYKENRRGLIFYNQKRSEKIEADL